MISQFDIYPAKLKALSRRELESIIYKLASQSDNYKYGLDAANDYLEIKNLWNNAAHGLDGCGKAVLQAAHTAKCKGDESGREVWKILNKQVKE